uniref:Uncharacterized protein n=1 Tax=Candidatus Kentrum sp. TC TaxID=2126339 RepID=A0A450ZW26_9GAMM|nr:MAG: hypothetical protein BECKTC1821E_GA0114239_103518 [Candidatus Kentron sp. TC]VFK44876.1 MAG: hypothetical protein BECKTC1821D_GA0114238_102223 [Candidatus Kentron sp. TC]VFK58004.1 MAG: hypothetical protein BECKTC1821F_GA0114240_102124 [Candidatus Kentron sp. TC]
MIFGRGERIRTSDHLNTVPGTIGAVAEAYRRLTAAASLSRKLLSDKTRAEYLRMLRTDPPSKLILAFGAMRPDDVLPRHVGEYLDLHPAPVAANRDIALLDPTEKIEDALFPSLASSQAMNATSLEGVIPLPLFGREESCGLYVVIYRFRRRRRR